MKHLALTLLAASALAASGWAHAQLDSNFTLVAGGAPVSSPFGSITMPSGSLSLTFSDDLIGALAVSNTHVSPLIAPTVGTVGDLAISVTSPIQSASGVFTSGTDPVSIGHINHVTTLGGISMRSYKNSYSIQGGTLSLSGLSVDLATQGIYATVSGANGLVTQDARIWDFQGMEGSLALALTSAPTGAPEHQPVGSVTLTGLMLTDKGIELFAQGLGLRGAGARAALYYVADAGSGTMTLTIPEPSTYLMMGLGLAGVAVAARRRRPAVATRSAVHAGSTS